MTGGDSDIRDPKTTTQQRALALELCGASPPTGPAATQGSAPAQALGRRLALQRRATRLSPAGTGTPEAEAGKQTDKKEGGRTQHTGCTTQPRKMKQQKEKANLGRTGWGRSPGTWLLSTSLQKWELREPRPLKNALK